MPAVSSPIRVRLSLVLTLLLLTIPAVAHARTGSLRLQVTGLPRGVRPQLRLNGPHAFHTTITQARLRINGLEPGRYVVRIRATRGRGATWTTSRARIRVRFRGRNKLVKIAYTQGVRDNVETLKNVHGASPAVGGGGALVVSKAAASPIRVGSYVAVGITPSTPRGLIGRVTSLTPHGSDVTVDTSPATITDLVPEGTIDLDIHGRRSTPFSTDDNTGDISEGITCTNASKLTLSGKLAASVSIHLTGKWHFHLTKLPTLDARLEGGIDQSASLTAAVTAAGKCKLDETPLGPEIELGNYPFEVAGIPFVANPKLEFSVDGEASASAAVTTDAGESLHADAGFSYKDGKASPFADFEPETHFDPPDFKGEVDLKAGAKAKLVVGIDGSGLGPFVSVEAGPDFSAHTDENPCWKLGLDLAVRGGVELGGVKVPELPIFDHEFDLAHGSDGCAPTLSVTNPGDQSTITGDAVNLPIATVDSDGGAPAFSATGLPPGLSIDSAKGLISGTATTAGTFQPVVTAKQGDQSATATFAWTVSDPLHAIINDRPGSVLDWGGFQYTSDHSCLRGEVNPPAATGVTGAIGIAAGHDGAYAVMTDGRVLAWGYNIDGALGVPGSGVGLVCPAAAVTPIDNAQSVVTGPTSTYVVRKDGTLWDWGENRYGELGTGNTTESETPAQVMTLGGPVTAVAANGLNGYALMQDGTVRAWGSGGLGALGNGTDDRSYTPIRVSALDHVVAIAASSSSAYALRADGTVWAWGANPGNGSGGSSNVPVRVTGLSDIRALANSQAAGETEYALRGDGTVWAWGSGASGALGDGTNTSEARTPVQVTGLHDIKTIGSGLGTGYAADAAGHAWAWGSACDGALGTGSDASGSNVPVPMKITGTVVAFAGDVCAGDAIVVGGT